jgi:hypothetical protein
MATLTIKINERSKAGKLLRDFLDLISDKPGVEIVEEKSPYDPEFVKMVKKSAASKNRTVIDTNDVWGSLGLR